MSAILDVDLSAFLGRIGGLYGKYRLYPPFLLREAAERWIARGIPLTHCVEVIERYLSRNASTFSCGSGDRNFAWLSNLIQTSWYERSFAMPHPAAEQTWPHNRIRDYGAVEQNLQAGHRTPYAEHPPSPPGARSGALSRPSPKSAPPGQFIPVEGGRPRQPSEVRAPGPKKIDIAVAWLQAELTSGEQAAATVEANARCAGIAPRTYDRARQRLGVTSRRVGFGRWARYLIALPLVDGTPNAPSSEAGAA